eukprot:TRINITY_DN8667_c1_g1_i2.p1 TRINITY_DN8667_c1_g1~~TRINITY_DN8667_c1_g1_i2.p1  ORF type:complete len:223 (+),score=-22.63 TRINITY_DN8667_c1_g1_i2:312-980(+)
MPLNVGTTPTLKRSKYKLDFSNSTDLTMIQKFQISEVQATKDRMTHIIPYYKQNLQQQNTNKQIELILLITTKYKQINRLKYPHKYFYNIYIYLFVSILKIRLKLKYPDEDDMQQSNIKQSKLLHQIYYLIQILHKLTITNNQSLGTILFIYDKLYPRNQIQYMLISQYHKTLKIHIKQFKQFTYYKQFALNFLNVLCHLTKLRTGCAQYTESLKLYKYMQN